MFMLARSKPNCLDVPRIPVVFIPGIMGTRLELETAQGMILWDPDSWSSTGYTWLTENAKTKGSWLHVTNPATVLGSASGISDDESARGWAGLVKTYYLGMLRALESGLAGSIRQCPVYAYGYDWRQSNEISGNGLQTFVNRVLVATEAKKVILVTHSMGGIVARWAMKNPDFRKDRVAGVIHIAQPVLGAPAAYRRLSAGTSIDFDGWAVDALIGNAEEAAEIFRGLPGAMELLPHDGQRNAHKSAHTRWMFHHKPGEPVSKNEEEREKQEYPKSRTSAIYFSAHYPPALFPESSSHQVELMRVTNAARESNDKLWKKARFHPLTRSIAGIGRPTDTAAVVTLTEDGLAGCTRDVDAGRSHEGDATVPLWSADALFPTVREDIEARIDPEVQLQWVIRGVDHDQMCEASRVQEVTVEIIEAMLLPPRLAHMGVGSVGPTGILTVEKALAGHIGAANEIRVAKLLAEEGHSVMFAENPDDEKSADLLTDYGEVEVKRSAANRPGIEDRVWDGLQQLGGGGQLIVVRGDNATEPRAVYIEVIEEGIDLYRKKFGECTTTYRLIEEYQLPPLWSPPPKDPR